MKMPQIPELVPLTSNVDFRLIDIFIDEFEGRGEVKNHYQLASILKAAKCSSELYKLATRQQKAIEVLSEDIEKRCLCPMVCSISYTELCHLCLSVVKAQKILNGEEK